jgi:hypothetical protein
VTCSDLRECLASGSGKALAVPSFKINTSKAHDKCCPRRVACRRQHARAARPGRPDPNRTPTRKALGPPMGCDMAWLALNVPMPMGRRVGVRTAVRSARVPIICCCWWWSGPRPGLSTLEPGPRGESWEPPQAAGGTGRRESGRRRRTGPGPVLAGRRVTRACGPPDRRETSLCGPEPQASHWIAGYGTVAEYRRAAKMSSSCSGGDWGA